MVHLVVKREKTFVFNEHRERVELTEIVDSDILGLKKQHRGNGYYYKEFTPGSVVSYALQYNECPIEAIATAKARGHELHWINASAAVLSDSPQQQRTLVEVEVGMVVRFQGLIARIENGFNGNLKFVPL